MKAETNSSRRSGGLAREPNLPDDFARQVIKKARSERRHRRTRRRVAAVVCAVLIVAALPLAIFMRSGRFSLTSRESPALTPFGWREQSLEEARANQLEQATTPDEIGDYILPNAATLTEFASAYTDTSWDYDSSRNDYR